MTEQSTEVPPTEGDPGAAAPRSAASDAAMARYAHSMRRSRAVYYATLAVIVIGVGVFVGVVWSNSEVAHASLHTQRPAPPRIGIDTPSANQQQVWQTADHIAQGAPQWNGTIVTYSQHSVGGRDGRTGKRTWVYTRTDRTVCTALQAGGTTIAIYANSGNCDEVSAFYSGTGRRRWTRTLDMDGMPLDGRPGYQVTPTTWLVYSGSVIYAIDPVTGYNRWTYTRYGCHIDRVVLGAAGALISQSCSAQVTCANVKFCARGPQLMLRDGNAGESDKAKPNADQVKWADIGDRAVPVSADGVLSAVDPDGRTLHFYDPAKGTRTQSVQLSPKTAGLGPITAIATSDAEVVWLAGRTYALHADSTTPVWAASTVSAPTIVSTTRDAVPPLATARITVPDNDGVAVLDGNDGRVISHFAVTPPSAGSLVYSLGAGFVVSGAAGIVAYR